VKSAGTFSWREIGRDCFMEGKVSPTTIWSRRCTEGCAVMDKKQGQVKKEYMSRYRVMDAQMGGGDGTL
jgi:hypothetical protein